MSTKLHHGYRPSASTNLAVMARDSNGHADEAVRPLAVDVVAPVAACLVGDRNLPIMIAAGGSSIYGVSGRREIAAESTAP